MPWNFPRYDCHFLASAPREILSVSICCRDFLSKGIMPACLVTQSCLGLFAVLGTVAFQAPLSMDSPGKNTGVDKHSLLQAVFPTQESNLCLLHCRWIPYGLSHQGSPVTTDQIKNVSYSWTSVNIHPTAKVWYKDYVQLILPLLWMRNPLSLPHIAFSLCIFWP